MGRLKNVVEGLETGLYDRQELMLYEGDKGALDGNSTSDESMGDLPNG